MYVENQNFGILKMTHVSMMLNLDMMLISRFKIVWSKAALLCIYNIPWYALYTTFCSCTWLKQCSAWNSINGLLVRYFGWLVRMEYDSRSCQADPPLIILVYIYRRTKRGNTKPKGQKEIVSFWSITSHLLVERLEWVVNKIVVGALLPCPEHSLTYGKQNIILQIHKYKSRNIINNWGQP